MVQRFTIQKIKFLSTLRDNHASVHRPDRTLRDSARQIDCKVAINDTEQATSYHESETTFPQQRTAI